MHGICQPPLQAHLEKLSVSWGAISWCLGPFLEEHSHNIKLFTLKERGGMVVTRLPRDKQLVGPLKL